MCLMCFYGMQVAADADRRARVVSDHEHDWHTMRAQLEAHVDALQHQNDVLTSAHEECALQVFDVFDVFDVLTS